MTRSNQLLPLSTSEFSGQLSRWEAPAKLFQVLPKKSVNPDETFLVLILKIPVEKLRRPVRSLEYALA